MTLPDVRLPDAAWSGGHLLLADPEAVSKVRRKWFSASVAAATLKCPASMAASRLIGQIEDPFGPRELGTARHAVMEDFYTLPADQRTLDAMDKIIAEHATKEWSLDKLDRQDKQSIEANDAARQRWIEEVTRGSRAIFNVEDPTTINVFSNEWKIFTHLGKGPGDPVGVPSILKIDRVVIGEDGGREVDDFKFKDGNADQAKKALAKPNPQYGDDYGDQQRLYVLGIEAETGERPKRASLIYPLFAGLYPGAPNGVRHIDISERELQMTLVGYKHAWDLMNASADRQKFETRPSTLCSWCVLANSCPVAQVGVSQARDPLKRQAAIEKQLTAAAAQPSAIELGIPVLRPGAAPVEARTGSAPGVQIPRQPEPIGAVGDDLFPITGSRSESFPGAAREPQGLQEPVSPPETVLGRHSPAERVQGAVGPAEGVQGSGVPEDFPGVDKVAAELAGVISQNGQAPRMWEADGEPAEEVTPPQNREAGPMTQNIQVRAEGPAYEETTNGKLNLNSFAAMAVTGIMSQSFEHLSDQNQPVTPQSLARFADVLAGVVLRVQYATTGQVNFQRGAQTRLRGLLRTVLPYRPAPFGRPAADWTEWMRWLERVLTISLTESINLYERGPVQNDSHLFFASDYATAPNIPTTQGVS